MVIMDLTSNMSANDLDDIKYLLHLEAIKRFAEDSKNLQRQVEEKSRIYLDAKQEYQFIFARLADICKQASLSNTLNSHNMHIDDSHVSSTHDELTKVSAAISSDQRPIELDSDILENCKNQLNSLHKPRQLLAKQQLNLVENIETLKTVRSSLDTLEDDFEATTLLAMNQLTNDIRPPSPASS